MSVIFSHALNAIKANPELSSQAIPKPTLISKTADNTKSILARIKKLPRKFNNLQIESEEDQLPERKVLKISHKLIKKPKHSIILRSKASGHANIWAHDLYEGPGPNLTNQYHTVFIRNLPELVDSDVLKKNINEKFREFVMGIKVL